MKKVLAYVGGIVVALLGAYAAIRIITKKRFKEEDFDENSEEDIFEESGSIDEDGVLSVDTTGDGELDTVLVDTTGDGDLDTVLPL